MADEVAKIAIEDDYVLGLYQELWQNEQNRRDEQAEFMRAMKPYKEFVKSQTTKAVNAGLSREVFIAGWKAFLLQEKRAELLDGMIPSRVEQFEHIEKMLGAFAETELGKAAIARADAESRQAAVEEAEKTAPKRGRGPRKSAKADELKGDDLDSLVDDDEREAARVSESVARLTGVGGIKELTH